MAVMDMADIALPRDVQSAERRFFWWMGVACAATAVCGFGLNFAQGRAQAAGLPLQVQLHASASAGWLVLYLVQSLLAARASMKMHRRLGWFGAGLAALMVPLGIATTVMAVRRGAVPFFFPAPVFLVLNLVGTLLFGATVMAAILLRQHSAWHGRLMCCAVIGLITPAFGRLLPMPMLGSWGPLALLGMLVIYLGAGMAFDVVLRRRVHPAWWWGGGLTVVANLLVGPIAGNASVRALALRLAGG